MSISDGQRVRALESNAAWASKQNDNTMLGKQTLARPASGATVVDVQQSINDINSDIATVQNDVVNLQSDVATLQALDTFVYVGVWDASSNTPTIADGDGGATFGIGATYRVSVAGTQDLGSGNITFAIGDKVVYNVSGLWEKWDTNDADIALDELSDVNTTGAAQRSLLQKGVADWEALNPNEISTNASLTGANQTIPATEGFFKVIRLTNASLASVEAIAYTHDQQKFILVNETGAAFDVLNDAAGTPTNGIITGTGQNLSLADKKTLLVVYDSTSARWRIVGGSGGGVLANDTFFQIRNAANSADLDIFKLDTLDQFFLKSKSLLLNSTGVEGGISIDISNSVSSGTAGGSILLHTGDETSSEDVPSGQIGIYTGNADSENSGYLQILTGDSDDANAIGGFNSGGITIRTGAGLTTSGSGGVNISSGAASSSSGNSGSAIISSGNVLTGVSGDVRLAVGESDSGQAGNLEISGGQSLSGTPGPIIITGGGSSSAIAGGPISIIAGTNVAGGTSGAVVISSGDANGPASGSLSGNVSILTAIADDISGDITIETGESLTSNSGNLTLRAGVAAGLRGKIILTANGVDAAASTAPVTLPKLSADPAPVDLVDGMVWYNTTSNETKARENGVTVVLSPAAYLYNTSSIYTPPSSGVMFFQMTGNSMSLPVGKWKVDCNGIFTSLDVSNLTGWSAVGVGVYFSNGSDSFTEPTATDANVTLLHGGGLEITTGEPIQSALSSVMSGNGFATVTLRGSYYIFDVTSPTTIYAVGYGDAAPAANARAWTHMFATRIG